MQQQVLYLDKFHDTQLQLNLCGISFYKKRVEDTYLDIDKKIKSTTINFAKQSGPLILD